MRLGIYVDDMYRITEAGAERSISTDEAFLLFACEVGARFESLVVFGRARRATAPADYELPTQVELVPLPHYTDLRQLHEVLRAARGTLAGMWRGLDRVDLVWIFGPHPFGLALVALALLRGKRVALGVRQDTLAYFRRRLPRRGWAPVLAAVWAMDAIYRLLARRLPTTVVGEDVARRYRDGRPSVLPTTISLVSAADVAERPPERDWGGTIELLTVGRIDPEKNPLLLVDVLARLERERPERYRLAWVGRGPLAEEVRRRARELGVAERIELPGYVPFGPRLLERYRRAHLFVHVSLTEGVPQVLIEALACGTPVVATDVGGVRAALDGGRAGLLVPPADLEALVIAVNRIADDAGLRDRLVLRGLELARGLTREVEAERVARFIGPPRAA